MKFITMDSIDSVVLDDKPDFLDYPREPGKDIYDLQAELPLAYRLLNKDPVASVVDLMYELRLWANYTGVGSLLKLSDGGYLRFLMKNLATEPLAKLLGSRLGSVLQFSGVNHPLFWISTACSGPEGPAASQETENKGIDVFSTERGDTGG